MKLSAKSLPTIRMAFSPFVMSLCRYSRPWIAKSMPLRVVSSYRMERDERLYL